MAERKRKFAKYPDCFGSLSIGGLVKAARRNGMHVIEAYKPGMHVYNEIGLFGTATQMLATEADWVKHGHEMKPRGFSAVFGVNLRRQRADWLSVPTQHRDYCKPDRRGPCSCDFDEMAASREGK